MAEYHYGNKIKSIQVGHEGDSAGCVKSINQSRLSEELDQSDGDKRKELIQLAIKKHCHFLLAGVAAVYIHDGKKRVLPTVGDTQDLDDCKKYLKDVYKRCCKKEEIYSVYFSDIVTILENKWTAVEELVKLIEDRYSGEGAFIDGDEAEQIIYNSIDLK